MGFGDGNGWVYIVVLGNMIIEYICDVGVLGINRYYFFSIVLLWVGVD